MSYSLYKLHTSKVTRTYICMYCEVYNKNLVWDIKAKYTCQDVTAFVGKYILLVLCVPISPDLPSWLILTSTLSAVFHSFFGGLK